MAAAPSWAAKRKTVDGEFIQLTVRVLGRKVDVAVWSPEEGALPLLIAHDGPEYDQRAALTKYAGATLAAGAVPAFRVALLPPGDRDEWYSASAAYAHTLCTRIVPALCEQVHVAGRPVGIGASLGALSMLHAQRSWPGVFAALFLQSGSFFVPRFDRHESGMARYGRIVRFVRGVLRASSWADPVPVSMTCGASEENVQNNRLMAAALAAQGYPAQLHELPASHDFESWRDALHPHLTGLLAELWKE